VVTALAQYKCNDRTEEKGVNPSEGIGGVDVIFFFCHCIFQWEAEFFGREKRGWMNWG
jgi:hypothetical protein